MDEIIYFELNNWMSGTDYPNAEPFETWCGNDLNLYFNNEKWVKENKLCVVVSRLDMSINWCITATKEWVMNNCPDLLSDKKFKVEHHLYSKDGETITYEDIPFSKFLRYPDEDGYVYSDNDSSIEFMQYSEEDIGIHYEKSDLYEDD